MLKIAIPIVLANATVPILGAVDTGVVGLFLAPGILRHMAVVNSDILIRALLLEAAV